VSVEVNRKLPVTNRTVQLLTLYTDHGRHNAQHYRRTDRQTDNSMVPINQSINQSQCLSIDSAELLQCWTVSIEMSDQMMRSG